MVYADGVGLRRRDSCSVAERLLLLVGRAFGPLVWHVRPGVQEAEENLLAQLGRGPGERRDQALYATHMRCATEAGCASASLHGLTFPLFDHYGVPL